MTQSRSQTLPIQRKIRLLKYVSMAAMMFFLSFFIAIVDPLEKIIDYQVSMRRGTFLYVLWEKPPLEVLHKIYLFNITNAEAFITGVDEKLKVQEIGPYVYQEILEHKNAVFHSNGTLSFEPIRETIFVPELSNGDPTKDILTTLNLPLLGASSAAAKISPIAALAISTVAKTTNSQPILNLTVHDFLWGYEDPLVHLAYSVLPSFINFKRFGLMDRLLDEGHNVVSLNLPKAIEIIKKKQADVGEPVIEERLEVDTLPNDVEYEDNVENEQFSTIMPKKLVETEPLKDYSINLWNGSPGLQHWGYSDQEPEKNSKCNTLQGSFDGTLFPKNMTKNGKFKIFRKAFCRTLDIEFSHPGTKYGIDAYYFKFAENLFDDTLDNPETICYCEKEKICLKKGLGNVTPCYYNIPLSVSLPHFYKSDPSLLNEVEGMMPDKNKHESEIVLQPRLGATINAKTRVQINLMTGETQFNSDVKPFDQLTFPVCWIDMTVDKLAPILQFTMKLAFNILPVVQEILIYVFGVLGFAFFAIASRNVFLLQPAGKKPILKVDSRKSIKYSAMFPYLKNGIAKFEEKICESPPKLETV